MSEKLRFIRKGPLFSGGEGEEVTTLFEAPVRWLSPFRPGKVIGMDAASAATVWALKLGSEPVTVLDMCCAPGMKLSLIHDCLVSPHSSVVGIDVSEHRLHLCKNLLRKNGYGQLVNSLFIGAPGWTKLSEDTPLQSLVSHFMTIVEKSSKKKRRRKVVHSTTIPEQFDRVLVDAECTHDGSDRHVVKHAAATTGGDNPLSGFWSRHHKKVGEGHYDTEEKMNDLIQLQKELIVNGFKLLKPNGILVYSTCSLQSRQNEEIVQFLFDSFPGKVKEEPLPFCVIGDDGPDPVVPATRINSHSCLFEPHVSGTSGQFISIIRKIE